MEVPKTKRCKNCKRDISEDVFFMHELHCERRITLCKVCEEPVPKTEVEEHMKNEHGPVPCELCGTSIPKHDLENHKDLDCPKVKKECKFCELDIERGEYEDHVESCGSRTDFCELCNQRVMLRNMQEHLENKCAPIGGEPMRNGGQTPPPAYGLHEQMGVSVDPQWLESVSGACREDDLQQMLMQNMGMRAGMGRLYEHSSSEDDSEFGRDDFSGGAPSNYPHAPLDYPGGSHEGRSKEEEEKLESERKDAELALRIHEQMNAIKPVHIESERRTTAAVSESQGPVLAQPLHGPGARNYDGNSERQHSGGLSMEDRDAELARNLYEKEAEYVRRNVGSGGQKGHTGWVDVSQYQGFFPEPSETQHGLTDASRSARDDSPEEEFDNNVRNRSPFTSSDRTSDPDALFARQIAQRDNDYVKAIDMDRKLAEQMQQSEDRKNRRVEEERGAKLAERMDAVDRERLKMEGEDRRMAERMQALEQQRLHKKEGGDLEVAHRLLPTDDAANQPHDPYGGYDYNRNVVMNEEPRPKTPVPQAESMEDEGQVPCQYCAELFPFKMIMEHQEMCLTQGQSQRKKMTEELFSNMKQQREQEDVMLTDETLQQVAGVEGYQFYDRWGSQTRNCKFCGEEMMLGRLQTHEVICEKNPDTVLSTVRRPAPPSLHQTSPERHDEAEDDEMPVSLNSAGPCEYCRKIIPLSTLVKHESTCHLRGHSSSRIIPHTQVRGMSPAHQADDKDSRTTSSSKTKPSLAIRFPEQQESSATHTHPQSSFSHVHSGTSSKPSSSFPVKSSDRSSFPEKSSDRSSFPKRSSRSSFPEKSSDRSSFPDKSSFKQHLSDVPSGTSLNYHHHQQQPGLMRNEGVVHDVKLRSESPFAVIGKGIRRPNFPGSSSDRQRTETEEQIREKLQQPMGRDVAGDRHWSTNDRDNPVNQPLDRDTSSLARRHLHDNHSSHHDRDDTFEKLW